MRNTVRLYIEGRQADLDDSSFILFNYTQEDLSNPTIVKNSFTKQITLKGTPTNDLIFGFINRNDRRTLYASPYNGPWFDPCRKTEFVLYNDRQEILEDGYLKLDKVVTEGKSHSFIVTLYGGLGSFLYGLSYKSSGAKMSLDDLFTNSIDFVINATTVKNAWARLGGDTSKPAKYDTINFMPGYFGYPSAPFDANKCLIKASQIAVEGEKEGYYTREGGYTLVTLPNKVTGNEAKDYRSYLQKPILNMAAVINAICNSSNNGGYTVNLDAEFFDAQNPYWSETWLTLPMLTDLNIDVGTSTSSQTIGSYGTKTAISGGGGSGNYQVTFNGELAADATNFTGNYKLWMKNAHGICANMIRLDFELLDSSSNVISTASYRMMTSGINIPSYYPQPDIWFDHLDPAGDFVDSNGTVLAFTFGIEAQGAKYYRYTISNEAYYWGEIGYNPGTVLGLCWPVGAIDSSNTRNLDVDFYNYTTVDVVLSYSSTVRSGASISKTAFLTGSKTPAEYLLSYCKMFGLQLSKRAGEKVIDITLRKNYYTGTTIDLTGRIDRSKPIEKLPFAFDSKWYVFGNQAEGDFAEHYQTARNRAYGDHRVNTGYSFDSEPKDVTDDIVFGNHISVVETSQYFADYTFPYMGNTYHIPGVIKGGGTYLLWNGEGQKSFDLPSYIGASVGWTNGSYPMHDNFDRVQFHGKENAHIDERDTLVFFEGMKSVSMNYYSLTDDTEEMMTLNDNTPCWLPDYCRDYSSTKITNIPYFTRYCWSSSTIILSLDWGDPLELQIPGASLSTSSIFDLYWYKYISDRYDDDNCVVTAYVDFRGIQVGQDLLRNFYAFDNAIWALNRIIDYSVTTPGTVKCEFVKVRVKTNYTTL